MSGIPHNSDERASGAMADDEGDCGDVMSRLSPFARGWGKNLHPFFVLCGRPSQPCCLGMERIVC
jgi:hypothetical protein